MRVVQRTARNPFAWFIYRACGRLSNYLGQINANAQFARQMESRNAKSDELIATLFPDLTVANGPFRGLRYPSIHTFGSALFPKLLGSYEAELQSILWELLRNEYSSVVDIGCGEGYYAVGLALRLPHAEVWAFDTDLRARELCASMAKLNGVEERVHIAEFCNGETLRSISLGDRALIVSDCEGYEGTLFTEQVAQAMRMHDLIVETHDFLDIELSARIRGAFAKTHGIRSIKSTDDITRAHSCQWPELKDHTTREKYLVLSEFRPTIMEWLVMTSTFRSKPACC